MRRNILSMIITSTLMSGVAYAEESEKKLVFYRDLAEYKESVTVEPVNGYDFKLDLIDTAVLSSFNIVMKKDGEDVLPSSIEIHEKSEENIFKLNKHKKVFVNGTEYTLEENGFGFIKLRNKDGYVTYVPKDKMESISFENDISSTNHIAKINLREEFKEIDLDYSYMIGMLSWKPSYKFYIKDKNTLQLDYFIEVNNKTLNTFEDINMEVVVNDTPTLLNKQYQKSENDGVFGHIKQNNELGGFKRNAYDFEGYSREGFDRNGHSYREPEKRMEENVEVFSLPNKITLSPKSISKHMYMDTKEIEYKKENMLYEPSYYGLLNMDLEMKAFFKTTSKLIIPNREGVLYQSGVGSLYSKEKLNKDKILLQEYSIPKGKKNKEFELNLGENNGLDVEAISINRVYSKGGLFIHNNKEDLLEKKSIIEKGYRSDESEYPISFSVEVNKIVLKADNKSNEDNLSLLRNEGYFFNFDYIEKVKSILSEYESLPTKEKTIEKKESILNKIKKYSLGDKLTFNLKDKKELVYYKLVISEEELNLNYFNKEDYSMEEMHKEKIKFDKYIKQL